jgi:hypothetical protein
MVNLMRTALQCQERPLAARRPVQPSLLGVVKIRSGLAITSSALALFVGCAADGAGGEMEQLA